VQWTTIYNAVVFGGAGVFSKNIKYQMPHLVWQFPDIKDIHPGSINVQLERPLHVARYVFVIASLSGLDMQTSPANIAERVPAVAVAKFYPSVGREPVAFQGHVANFLGPGRATRCVQNRKCDDKRTFNWFRRSHRQLFIKCLCIEQ
jgi:hypothetical protein